MRTLFFVAALLLVACGGSDTQAEEPVIVLDEPADETADDTSDAPALVVSDDACETDADCVPAGCCHADACGAEANAPSCEDTMCTTDCQFGTLDCGGACLCHEGHCAARLSQPPELRTQ